MVLAGIAKQYFLHSLAITNKMVLIDQLFSNYFVFCVTSNPLVATGLNEQTSVIYFPNLSSKHFVQYQFSSFM